MIWEEWITNVSTLLGMDVITGGTVISLFFIICITLVCLVATRGRGSTALIIVGFSGSAFFTMLGWLSSWVMLLIVLLIAGLYASKIRDIFGG